MGRRPIYESLIVRSLISQLHIFDGWYPLTVTLFFILWVGFLSPNTIGTQIKAARELRQLKRTKDYYQKDILHNEALIHQILSDPEFVEKFGRETYLMKRENEDIYLFE